jgi:hypothetical protein
MTFEQALADVAAQYRGEGYQVTVHPKGDQVPPVAGGYEPELIALKNGPKRPPRRHANPRPGKGSRQPV